ncbi:MAG: competence/damage-inducible protein A [Bauldia sp.]
MANGTSEAPAPTAAVLIIGDEILSGRTLDTNIGTIARFLTPRGIDLREVRVVADDEDAIVAAVNALRDDNSYVFTTGGIGPTHDDITAAAIARAFGVPLLLDPRAVAILEVRYGAAKVSDARLRMARIPEGAELIANSETGAPGFRIGNVHVMAGIPSVMAAMLEALAPMLSGGAPMLSRTVPAALGESFVAAGLETIQAAYPDVSIGSYPQQNPDGGFTTELVLRSRDAVRLDAATAEVTALVERTIAARG